MQIGILTVSERFWLSGRRTWGGLEWAFVSAPAEVGLGQCLPSQLISPCCCFSGEGGELIFSVLFLTFDSNRLKTKILSLTFFCCCCFPFFFPSCSVKRDCVYQNKQHGTVNIPSIPNVFWDWIYTAKMYYSVLLCWRRPWKLCLADINEFHVGLEIC